MMMKEMRKRTIRPTPACQERAVSWWEGGMVRSEGEEGGLLSVGGMVSGCGGGRRCRASVVVPVVALACSGSGWCSGSSMPASGVVLVLDRRPVSFPRSRDGMRAIALMGRWSQRESKTTAMMPAISISSGKYHKALYSRPAAAPRNTRDRVSLSVMAFWASCTAARATMPTVACGRYQRIFSISYFPTLVDTYGVEAREQSVDGARQGLADVGDADGQTQHAEGPREAPDQEAQHGREEAVMDQADAVQHLGAARPGKGLAHAEQLLVQLLVDPLQLLHKLVVKLESYISAQSYSRAPAAKTTYDLKVHRRAAKRRETQIPRLADRVPKFGPYFLPHLLGLHVCELPTAVTSTPSISTRSF
jgi:hypothetical protein